jgi:hypothetical protein
MSNYTASNVVKFTGSPNSVDTANEDTVTPPEKFTHCPRGREVNVVGGGVSRECGSFAVPDVPLKSLKAKYPHEWNSFRAMKYRRCGKDGKYNCHPDIDSFPKFLAAFGPIPEPGYTLDRLVPTDLTYGPGKCEWAPKQRQAENKTNNKYLTTSDGTCLHVSEWSRRSGIPRKTVLRRVNELGWSVDDAVGVRVGGKRPATPSTPSTAPTKKSLFPDAPPSHVQSMLDKWIQGLRDHHDCEVFLLEWKHIKILEYIHEGLLRCDVPPSRVVEMIVEDWCRFTEKYASAHSSKRPRDPDLYYLKQNIMPAAHYYLCNDGERLSELYPEQPPAPTTPIDPDRDL